MGFVRKGVLRNFENFTAKQLYQSLPEAYKFIKKRLCTAAVIIGPVAT